MKTIKLGLLVNYRNLFDSMQQVPLKALTGKQSLALHRALEAIQSEIRAFDQQRENYIHENGIEREDGTIAIEGEDQTAAANQWIQDLLDTQVEITWPAVIDEDVLERLADNVILDEQTEMPLPVLSVFEQTGLLAESLQ